MQGLREMGGWLKWGLPLLLVLLSPGGVWASEAAHSAADWSGLPMWSVVPFVALLLGIAILPLAAGHWWEHNHNKGIVAAVLAIPVVIYLVTAWGGQGGHALFHAAQEYIAFIMLLGALFVISGGIYVQGSLSGTPLVNSGLLAFGTLIASFVGTTGASVLLIRPLLRANKARQRKAHIVVFFIFMVSNCGGLLTPLGDPPLFLGFLNGVPFGWTLRLWAQWAFVNGVLLVLFHIWDEIVFNREEKERAGSQLEAVMQHEPLRVNGLHNLAFLLGVIGVIYASGTLKLPGGASLPWWAQPVALGLLGLGSYFSTPRQFHQANRFSFGPINEVAILFSGIFVTMIPALKILEQNGDQLGVKDPWQFFWAAGLLSSFLDNAPTYLTFAVTAAGMSGVSGGEPGYLTTYLTKSGAAEILAAISCGAVFMGANTYIGNGPNFMVKAIAEENGVKMPGFFGYMAYSMCILVPVFIVVTFLFFR